MHLRHRSINGRGSATTRGKRVRVSPEPSLHLSPLPTPCPPAPELPFRAPGSSEMPSLVIVVEGLEQVSFKLWDATNLTKDTWNQFIRW